MKCFFTFLVFLACMSYASAQNGPKAYGKKSRMLTNEFGAIGLAAGQEHFIALKGSIVWAAVPWKNKYPFPQYGFFPTCLYGSLELSMGGMFAIWGGIGLNAGLALGPVTLDNSITCWGIAGERGHGFGRISYSPKLGLRLWPVWIKAGPAYLISGKDFIPELFRIGTMNYNFEILYINNF